MSIPGSASPLFIGAAAGAAAAYQIDRSVRLNPSDSSYFSRTPSSAGNRKTWTWSGWIKLGKLASSANVHEHIMRVNTGPETAIRFKKDGNADCIQFYTYSGSLTSDIQTSAVFRDHSAWYHLVVACDTTQSTSSERVKIYINGVLQSLSTSAYPSQNYDTGFNTTNAHGIAATASGSELFDGYLADVHFIDGQALAPTDFGEFDSNNNWNPIDCKDNLTYGTNGFYLKFADNSSNAALGTDSSGNSNTWTVNNLSVASGAGNDSLIDTPTNYTAASGNNGGNYATLNPLHHLATATLANGNLQTTSSNPAFSTFLLKSGKWYCEHTVTATGYNLCFSQIDHPAGATPSSANSESIGWYTNGTLYWQGGSASAGASYGIGDVLGAAIDMDNTTITLYKNGTQTTSINFSSGYHVTFAEGMYVSQFNGTGHFNFGQRQFAYPVSGYKSICTTNLPDPTIADGSTAFTAKTFTANASNQTITTGFSPDFVWVKSRANAYGNELYDIVRGTNLRLTANTGAQEQSLSNQLTSFNSDGFTLGNASSSNYTNNTASIAWAWDAGTSTVSNTDGSITSSVRANASAGISIVSFTNAAGTVGHSLSAPPEFIITKRRDAAYTWSVYTKSTTKDAYLGLNTTSAAGAVSGMWGSAEPTSSVFGTTFYVAPIGSSMIAYCFAPVNGFSAMGSFVGNGSATDGPFVFTGMRPKFILAKIISGNTDDWIMYDTERSPFNPADDELYPNQSSAEVSGYRPVDILSNGFKIRNNSNKWNGANGYEYVYLAFAEHPFKTARAT